MGNNAVQLHFGQELGERQTRRVYLITYSQANLEQIPNCQAFANCVLEAFSQGSNKSDPEHWSCCMEDHRDGGKHYHMAIKLSAPKRWKPVKNYLRQKHDIHLHFSEQAHGYHAAYKYVCKNKPLSDVLHSADHPNLQEIGSPKTKRAFNQSSHNAKKRRTGSTSASSSNI